MINSKLISVLSALETEEFQEFIDFVKSPYYNKKENLITLCQALRVSHPNYTPQNIERQSVFNKIFPNKPYDEKKLGYMQSDLTKLVLNYMHVKAKERKDSDISLLDFLAEKKLDHFFIKESKKINQILENSTNKGASYYKAYFEYYDLHDRYFISSKERKDDINAHLASNNLDLFFICRKLQYFTILLNRKLTIGKEVEIPDMDFVLSYAKKNFNSNPIVNAYYEVIMMQSKEESLPHFNKLKKIISELGNDFNPKEIAEIYEYAINYCIQRISYNQEFYTNEALILYMQFLDSGYMYQNGYLSQWTFKNIIKLSLLLNRFEFIENFIISYKGKIQPKHQIKALNYNFAELHFAMQNYSTAQEYLNKVFVKDLELVYNLGSRMMLIKIFYHNNEMDALLSQIAAFTIFLKRAKKISNTKKKIYLNFCDILNKIMRQNLKHYEKIEQEINDTKLLTATSWLLRVYQEMKPIPLKKQSIQT